MKTYFGRVTEIEGKRKREGGRRERQGGCRNLPSMIPTARNLELYLGLQGGRGQTLKPFTLLFLGINKDVDQKWITQEMNWYLF